MGGDEEIGFDGSRPATLHNGAISTDFPTLLEAIMAWHKLRPEQAQRASIRIIGGELYAAAQIPKLLNGSKRHATDRSTQRAPKLFACGLL
jgi:hypothetical protein